MVGLLAAGTLAFSSQRPMLQNPTARLDEGLSAMGRAVGAILRLYTRKLSPSELQSRNSQRRGCTFATSVLLLYM